MIILNALTQGILAGLTAVGFLIVMGAVYCFFRVVGIIGDAIAGGDDDAGMDD